jgi:hypothetical protein
MIGEPKYSRRRSLQLPAKALDITISPSLLATADEVIELYSHLLQCMSPLLADLRFRE